MRVDGKRLKNVDPMYTIIPYIMKQRNDAQNAITVRIPYHNMHEYIVKKRKEGIAMSYMSLVLAAYVRTVSEYPFLNRFIVNKRIYARNELVVSMVVLRENQEDETMDKIKFELTDTIFDVNNNINAFITKNRADDSNSTDKLMKVLTRLPGLLSFVVGIIKWFDKHGWLPKALIDASPFHSSMVISNLASIRTNHLHHHCYNFGTTSIIMTMGTLQDIPKEVEGEIILEKVLPLGIMTDERIGSGLDFSKAFKSIKRYLKDPTLLEQPPKTVKTDLEYI